MAVEKALEKDTGNRYQSMRQTVANLRRFARAKMVEAPAGEKKARRVTANTHAASGDSRLGFKVH
jgi:hypothetical protein